MISLVRSRRPRFPLGDDCVRPSIYDDDWLVARSDTRRTPPESLIRRARIRVRAGVLADWVMADAVHHALRHEGDLEDAVRELLSLAGNRPVALRRALAHIVRVLAERPTPVGQRAEEIVRAALAAAEDHGSAGADRRRTRIDR